MRAKVQITISFELGSPNDYPDNNVNSWIEAANYDVENCIGVRHDIDATVEFSPVELEGEPDTEPFERDES